MAVTRVKAVLLSKVHGTVSLPGEYLEYRMCRAFNCLPHDLDELDEDTYTLFAHFLSIEGEAATISAIPSGNG